MEKTAQEIKDEVIDLINYAREVGESDLSELKEWVEYIDIEKEV